MTPAALPAKDDFTDYDFRALRRAGAAVINRQPAVYFTGEGVRVANIAKAMHDGIDAGDWDSEGECYKIHLLRHLPLPKLCDKPRRRINRHHIGYHGELTVPAYDFHRSRFDIYLETGQ